MTVGIIGSGDAVAAVEAALEETVRTTADRTGEYEGIVAIGQSGDQLFETVNERALDAGQCWIAVEIGGIGGAPVVDASVAVFGPGVGCYDCLRGRVEANQDRQEQRDEEPAPHTVRFAGAIAGRQSSRLLAGDETVIGRVITPPFDERRFLPLPNCRCGNQPSRTLDRTDVDRPLEESLARAEQALDETVGLIQQVGEAESFPVPYYLSRGCDTTGFSDASAARDAAGVAIDWNSAFMKALGEGLERYCAGVYRTADLERATPAEMDDAVAPGAFVCEREPEPTTEIEWVPGEAVATGETCALPAEFVYHPPPSSRYHSPVTTGLGLGNSPVEAMLAGLYEVIERDAMMLSWYSTYDPLGVQIEDETYETLTDRARSEGLSVSTLLLTQDVDIPVVAAVVRRDAWPKLAVGTGAHLDVTRAARSALAEALQNWTELRGMGPEDAADALGAIGTYAEEPGEAADFIEFDTAVPGDSVGPETVPTGASELDVVCDRLGDAGLESYAARLTTRDVEQLGFEAVRVVVPSAQPLTFGTPTFGDRANTVPEALGFEPTLSRDHHPFP